MGTLYEDDVIAWSEQQAALLCAGRWELLDRDNIAGEIEDVGHREKKSCAAGSWSCLLIC